MEVLKSLMTSKVRAALVARLTAADDDIGSLSQLARELSVTPRAVAREAERLEKLGLLKRVRVGREDRLKANQDSPLLHALAELVTVAAKSSMMRERRDFDVRRDLVCYGAPLAGTPPSESPKSLIESVLSGLSVAKHYSTLLRVLPVVLVKNRDTLDLDELIAEARRRKLRAELGMLLELTARLVDWPEIDELLPRLRDSRRKRKRFFFEPRSRLEASAMKARTRPFAEKWGFWLNMDESTFRSTLALHDANVHR